MYLKLPPRAFVIEHPSKAGTKVVAVPCNLDNHSVLMLEVNNSLSQTIWDSFWKEVLGSFLCYCVSTRDAQLDSVRI